MALYYGIATNGTKNFVIDNLSEVHAEAYRQVMEHCNKAGLEFQGLRGTKDNASTLTKFAKARKIKNGKAGRIV